MAIYGGSMEKKGVIADEHLEIRFQIELPAIYFQKWEQRGCIHVG